jgi:hypothetical protein
MVLIKIWIYFYQINYANTFPPQFGQTFPYRIGFPPVKIVPHLTHWYFLPDLVLPMIMLPKVNMMARTLLIRINGTTNAGSTAFMK